MRANGKKFMSRLKEILTCDEMYLVYSLTIIVLTWWGVILIANHESKLEPQRPIASMSTSVSMETTTNTDGTATERPETLSRTTTTTETQETTSSTTTESTTTTKLTEQYIEKPTYTEPPTEEVPIVIPEETAPAETEPAPVTEETVEQTIVETTTVAAETEPPTEAVSSRPYIYDCTLSDDLQQHIYDTCARYGVPYELVMAVIKKESTFNTGARNGSCVGLMQLHSGYNSGIASSLGVSLYDPYGNTTVGIYVIADLMSRHSMSDALICYNMGEYGAKPYLGGSTSYSRKVMAYYYEYLG